MNLKPLGDRVIVEVVEEEEVTVSGIVLPDTAKEKPQRGRVLAVGAGRCQRIACRGPFSVARAIDLKIRQAAVERRQAVGGVARRINGAAAEISAVVLIILLHLRARCRQVIGRFVNLAADDVAPIRWQGDGRQDGDNGNGNHQFDQSEPRLTRFDDRDKQLGTPHKQLSAASRWMQIELQDGLRYFFSDCHKSSHQNPSDTCRIARKHAG